MDSIRKKYLFDEAQNKVAVLIEIEEFKKLEQLLEDYALGKFIEDNDPSENMSLNEARMEYARMKNSK